MNPFQDRPVILRNVRLVDIENGRTDKHASDIWVDRGRFRAIAPSGQIPREGLPVIDGMNRFALPGLIDAHVHICGIFLTEIPQARDLAWLFRQIRLNHRAQLRSGVTLVRDMMAPLRVSLLFRSLAADPRSGFPRVLCAGPMLTVPGGYPPYIPQDRLHHRALAGPLRVELRTTREAHRWVDRLALAGVDWVKLGFQGAAFDTARTPIRKPSAELFRSVVDRAHDHGLPVAVHHYWLADLRELVDLPFDTLEHITEDAPIDDDTLQKMARRSLPVTTDLEQSAFAYEPQTFLRRIDRGQAPLLAKPRRHIARLLRDVAAGRDICGLTPRRRLMELAFVKDMVLQKMQNLKRLSDAGIPIGAATDAGVHMYMGILPDELCRMTRAGLRPAQALRTATTGAARLLGIDEVGRIRPGFRADLVLYEGNPLENIESVKKPVFVMRDGVPVIPEA